MANTKISQLTATTNPTWWEELVYAYNNANGKMTLDTMKTFASAGSQPTLVSGTNIKTINGDSILWSWNLVVSGWWGISTLSADANIWELSDGIYETEYDLYYMTWQEVPRGSGSWLQYKQMISVVQWAWWTRGFMVINSRDRTWIWVHWGRAFYWYSTSSSEWVCNQLWSRDYVFQNASVTMSTAIDAIIWWELTQIVNAISWNATNDLRISVSNPPYPWLTYTIYISSVADAYSITLWTWVTNPFGISLPNNSSKWCIITVLVTSTTTWIVTSCTMMP